YRHMAHKGLLRLIPLLPQALLSSQPAEGAYQILVDPQELQKQLLRGQGTIAAFVNTQTCVQHLSFALDSRMQLVVRDTSNQDIPLGISGVWPVSSHTEQEWQRELESLSAMQQKLYQQLMLARSQFTQTLPHHFADQIFIDQIQASLDQLLTDLTQLAQELTALDTCYRRVKEHASA
ncbi:MAG: regulatory ATPase RavA LARA domain-containing protein, partial [Plesiomonas sp.]